MLQRYDHISLFVSLFGIPVCVGNLFKGVAPVNDRSYLPCLNKLFEEYEIFSSFRCYPAPYFLAACHRGPEHVNKLCQSNDSRKIGPLFRQGAFAS